MTQSGHVAKRALRSDEALHKNPPATGLPNIATKSSPVGRPTPLNSSTRSHGAWCEVFVDALGHRTSRFERSGKPLWIIGPDPTNVTILEVQPWTDDVIRNVGVDGPFIGQHISAVPLGLIRGATGPARSTTTMADEASIFAIRTVTTSK